MWPQQGKGLVILGFDYERTVKLSKTLDYKDKLIDSC